MTDNLQLISNKQGQVSATPAPEISLVERAELTAKRMEEANKKAEELLAKNENIMARIVLSGRAEAGVQGIKEETPEEKIKREAREMLKGTGLDPFK